MLSDKKKILLVSHDATRTGAPILLLNLAKLLQNNEYEVDILLKRGGVLEGAFKASFTECYNASTSLVKRLLRKAGKRFPNSRKFNLRGISFKQYDAIVSNTITNGDVLPLIREQYQGKIFSYVHELEMATSFFTNERDLNALTSITDHYLVPAEAVKKHLLNNLKVPEEKISLLHYYIPGKETTSPVQANPEEAFIVGAVGTTDWRKSPDLFILIAQLVFKKDPSANIKFRWKGAPGKGVDILRLRYDLKHAQLEGKVEFLVSSDEVTAFYASLDLLLLTSREDPYPLVILEAADAAVPAICFKSAGGAPEFVESSSGGCAIDYLDIERAAAMILYYYKNPVEKKNAGSLAKKLLKETHQSDVYILNQFKCILESTIK